ncbi:MAG: glycosyltransferase [Verrucomicrobiota bacterium]
MIRALHVIDKLSVDGSGIHGISRALEWWASNSDPTKVCFRILSLRGREEEAAEFFAARGIDLQFVSVGKFDPRTIGVICREARGWNADLLHLHGYASTNFGRIASRRLKIPNIVHEHVVFPSQPFVQRIADRVLSRWTDSSLAISSAVARFMIEERKVPQETLETFFYGIPFDEFEEPSDAAVEAARQELGVPSNARIVVTAGRLAPQKGLDTLVQAFAKIPDELQAHLVIVGEGPDRERIEKLRKASGLESRIHLVGFQKDVRPWIAMADVFAIASHYEGGPITLLEAMRLSRAIVTTPVGLVPEAIQDGKNGLQVPVGDEKALTDATVRILQNSDLRESLGNAARQSSDQWDVRVAVKRLLAFYEKVLEKK